MDRVLLVVDIQKGFITPCSVQVLEPIRALTFRFSRVVFAKFYNNEGSPFRNFLNYHDMPSGSADGALALETQNAAVVEHPGYSCVTPELIKMLHLWGVKQIYVCGIATEACVLKTVADLFELNIRPLLIEDLCASDRDPAYHLNAISLLEKLIGPDQITHVRDLIG